MDEIGLTASLEKLKKEKKMQDEQFKEQEEKGNLSEAEKIRQLFKQLDAELEKAKKKEEEVKVQQVEIQSRTTLVNKDPGKAAISKVESTLKKKGSDDGTC